MFIRNCISCVVVLLIFMTHRSSSAEPEKCYTIYVRELNCPEKLIRMPFKSNETVLDAVASLKIQSSILSQMEMGLARFSSSGKVQVLRIDWASLTEGGSTKTNFVVFPGDVIILRACSPK